MEKQRVLIIEDDRDTATFFSMVMSLVGFRSDVVYNAKDAFAQLAVSEPDLILLDMRLGYEIDGKDILYQIRSNPRLDQTRVIVITAYPTMADDIETLADLTLLKPVELEQLKNLATRLWTHEAPSSRQYFRDPVTELFNEQFFHNRLEHAIERASRRSDYLYSVILINLDSIDGENPDLDLDIRNAVYKQVARRLTHNTRPSDTIARFEGGKFASLHEELKQRKDIHIIIKRVSDQLDQPYHLQGKMHNIAFSLGALICDSQYKGTAGVLKDTRRALEKAQAADGEKVFIIGLE